VNYELLEKIIEFNIKDKGKNSNLGGISTIPKEEDMEVFAKYLAGIDNTDHRDRTEEILGWVANKFPNLEPLIKWNTPMFSDHGTYIIGFSTAKHHLSVAPEEVGIAHFADDIAQAGYSATKGLFRIPWNEPVNYELLEKMIEYNIQDKTEYTNFWRK
jgi:uncharacterized protein YdhG (YjbR/CyaY superfamily)